MMDTLFNGGAAWFSVPALLGTLIFVIRIGLMLVGGDAGGDFDLDIDLDVDPAISDTGHAFEVFSFQSLTAFAMGFGWGGLGGLRGAGWDYLPSVIVAIAAGVGMVWLLGLLLKGIHDLQSSGNVSINQAIGVVGEIYATVPASGGGRGQIRLVIDGRQRLYNAFAEAEELPTGARATVVRANPDNTLTVARV